MNKNNELTIRVIPKTYLKYGFIVITTGFRVFINGKKYPKKRGAMYTAFNNTENTVKQLALKEYKTN